MQETSLFLLFTKRFDALKVEYMVTGSVASIVYGEPRMTHDVDLVVTIPDETVPKLNGTFPDDEFYCPPVEVIRTEIARAQRGHFNIIHHQTGYKADVYIMGADSLHAWAWTRRKSIPIGPDSVRVAPPEYVILRKLEYFREGGSQKHLEDIAGILRSDAEVDLEVVREKALGLGLNEAWQQATKRSS